LKRPKIQLALLLLGCGGLFTTSAQTLPGWNLVWSDEFTQADGTPPDPANWGYEIGGNGWGNNELEYYTSRTNNARIEGGHLVIEARQALRIFSFRSVCEFTRLLAAKLTLPSSSVSPVLPEGGGGGQHRQTSLLQLPVQETLQQRRLLRIQHCSRALQDAFVQLL
jgi:hypothetical protein